MLILAVPPNHNPSVDFTPNTTRTCTVGETVVAPLGLGDHPRARGEAGGHHGEPHGLAGDLHPELQKVPGGRQGCWTQAKDGT